MKIHELFCLLRLSGSDWVFFLSIPSRKFQGRTRDLDGKKFDTVGIYLINLP